MKKRIACFLCLLLMGLFCINVYADGEDLLTTSESKKVTVYIFTKDGCPHCIEAEEFFETLAQDKEYGKYFDLVNYQVYDKSWKEDEETIKIMNNVAEEKGDDVQGVPYIVIGEDYSTNGYASSLDDEIKEAIKKNYESDDYHDLVADVISNIGTEPEKNNDTIIIIAILVAVIGGCGTLVYFSRKK